MSETGSRPRPFVVALDGPAASGKSTVGEAVARRLGFFYFDTGVLYRALTWVALEWGVSFGDGPRLAELARSVRLEVAPPTRDDGRQMDVLVDGADVTWQVRRPEVDASVSAASAHPEVRRALVALQRAAIRPPGSVLVGRDIGTVIAPDAELKVWLSASAEVRARRRCQQTGEPYQAVLQAMVERDRFDSTRAAAPMVRAVDAVEIDTDRLSVGEVVDRVVALVRERMEASG